MGGILKHILQNTTIKRFLAIFWRLTFFWTYIDLRNDQKEKKSYPTMRFKKKLYFNKIHCDNNVLKIPQIYKISKGTMKQRKK
jgi:hypothetical protein